MTWRRLVPGVAAIEVALALTTSAAGALVYLGFFATLGYLPGLGFACLVGGATAALGHRRTWSTMLLAAVGLALVLVFGVFRGDGTAVPDGVRGSWNRLLTVAAPADTWSELLVVPALVTWAAAFTSVVLVLRTRNVLAPLVPPLAGFVFAVVAVGNQAGGHAIATVVFLVAALGLTAVRTHRGTVHIGLQSSRPITALAMAVLMVAASALFGVVGGQTSPLASGEHRFDPRDMLAPAVTSTDALTPLAQLKPQIKEHPARTLFTLRTDAESSTVLDRVRTAALDAFDGTTWTSTDTYRVAGTHLTADPAQTSGRTVTARIELRELTGPYLPVVGWPSRLTADGDTQGRFGIDTSSGVVISAGVKLEGLRYDVTGEVSVRDPGLQRAFPAADHVPALPAGMPEALRAYAGRLTDAAPYEQLRTLETALHSMAPGRDWTPGHSYAAITRSLTTSDGHAEQRAAAFAVIARTWGLPARVAVGYRLDGYRNGVFRVTTADAHAWPEVHFAGYGWVAFEPSHPDNGYEQVPPPEAPRVVPPQPAPSTTALAAAPPIAPSPSEPGGEQGFGLTRLLHGSALLVSASVLVVVLASGAIVITKAYRRKRRRRRPDRAAMVLGAWQEQIDRLTERGLAPPVSLTFHEVAEHVRGSLGDAASPIEASAELATTAVYAPEHLDESAADRAWQLVAELRSGLHPRPRSAARLLAAVHPRPLWTSWSMTRQRRQAHEDLETGRYR